MQTHKTPHLRQEKDTLNTTGGRHYQHITPGAHAPMDSPSINNYKPRSPPCGNKKQGMR